ncbi:MAG: hypothetical protein KDI06_12545 [Calditrichaeota bacterium]|nr:hypothetical protein [Calditrichota bacterium]
MSQLLLTLLLISVLSGTGLRAQENPRPEVQGISRTGASNILLSLVLPGAGEWRMGERHVAKWFLGAELGLWLGYYSSRRYVNNLQENMEAFAALHAGVDSRDKDGQYWIDIGVSENIYVFNAEKLLERDLSAVYAVGAGFDWQWDSDENRRNYVSQRFKRLDWKRSSTWIVSGLVLNRLVSAIDIIRLLRKGEDSLSTARQSALAVGVQPTPDGREQMRLNFVWWF